MKAEIIPGILTHNLEEYIARLEMVEQSKAAWVQVDIMDGHFVPNISVMPNEFMGITTRLKIEAHLMVYRPERYYSDMSVANVQRVLIHREAYDSLEEAALAVKAAKDYFPEVGLVYNPETAAEDVSGLNLNAVQCMGVHPGSSGQQFVEDAYATIREMNKFKGSAVLAVDGGIREDSIDELKKLGVSRFIITSQLFVANDFSTNLQFFSQLITGGA